jgi:hypothetical protein
MKGFRCGLIGAKAEKAKARQRLPFAVEFRLIFYSLRA